MPKFMGIDLPDSLEKIMKKNTMSYQGDFEYDRKERRVCLKATAAYNIWTYYGGWRNERILAYAIEVTGLEDGKVMGNLYPLDYREHVEYVKRMSVPANQVRVVYEKGEYYQDKDERKREKMRCGKVENHIRNIRKNAV